MADEYEPSGRGFLDVFVPISEPPHADYLVDDPLFLGRCGDYPSCIATSVFAITTIVLALLLFVIQFHTEQYTKSHGLYRIRYITRRTSLLSTVLMSGWILPLFGQYHAWQIAQDFLLFNNSVVLIFTFSAIWFEFFAVFLGLVQKQIPVFWKALFWIPAGFCFIFFNLHIIVAATLDYMWPRIVLFWIVGVLAIVYLIVGWWFTYGAASEMKPKTRAMFSKNYAKYDLLARLHYSVVWGSVIVVLVLIGTLYRATTLGKLGYYDRYWSLYMDDTLFHFCAVIFQGCGLLLTIYAGWVPMNRRKSQS